MKKTNTTNNKTTNKVNNKASNAQNSANTKNCGRGGKCSGSNNTKDCK